MTTPELPGAGSQQHSPQYQAPTSFPPQGPGGPTQPFSPQPPQAKKQLNVVGLVALIAAVLGLIFSCVPGALIVGWILLPVGFILSIVSLFLKDKAKWMGIAALVTSVVGTIVAVLVFIAVVATSFNSAFGSGDTKVVQPSASAGASNAPSSSGGASEQGTRANPYPLGSTIESKDWRVVVNSVTLAATDAVMAANQFNDPPAAGSEYILINYSVTYIGDDPQGQMPFTSLEYVTPQGNSLSGSDKSVVAPDEINTFKTLYSGATVSGNDAIEVPSATAGQGVLAIRPGMLADKVFVAVK
ncbi:MgtC/SapB family protein [Paenarthrobacter sp. NPDC090522]|uniref:MgtC/SapB family protein n=1 Tax=Paenarthrobacter sp. NPDC090522 TaxID=3364383 RepID=UPI0037FB9D4F